MALTSSNTEMMMKFVGSFLVLVGAGLLSSEHVWARYIEGFLLLAGMDRFGFAIKQEIMEAVRRN